MGFRPNTKGKPKQPKTGVASAFRAKRRYKRMARRMPTKRLVRKNAATVAGLLKRVRLNELDKHGSCQTNKQMIGIPPNPGYPATYPDVRAQYPLLFNVNNFASQPVNPLGPTTVIRAPVFQMVGAAGAAVPTAVADFIRVDYTGVGVPTDIQKTSLWRARNLDIPDTGKYYAQSSQYMITVTTKGPVRVNIMFFTQKSTSIPTSSLKQHNWILPEAMDGLNNMASGNALPRSGFRIYRSYTKFVDPTKNQSSETQTFYYTFNHNKLINQFVTKPATADTPDTTPLTGWNYNNVPVTQPLWCLISTNASGQPGAITQGNVPCLVNIRRTVKWRDHIGADH